jgi:metal-responsive CopG/Arc/MetJ family transcriptional regulator
MCLKCGDKMPRTLRGEAVPRKNIRIPKPMMDQVERIVEEHPELYNNRQQFIEAAIRENIEKYVRGNTLSPNK